MSKPWYYFPLILWFDGWAASVNPFNSILKTLERPGGGGEFGKYYSLTSLNDPRIGWSKPVFFLYLKMKIRWFFGAWSWNGEERIDFFFWCLIRFWVFEDRAFLNISSCPFLLFALSCASLLGNVSFQVIVCFMIHLRRV